MKKYYWYCLSFKYYSGSEADLESGVLENKHPFEYQKEILKMDPMYDAFIVNWKEITEEEFLLYTKLFLEE